MGERRLLTHIFTERYEADVYSDRTVDVKPRTETSSVDFRDMEVIKKVAQVAWSGKTVPIVLDGRIVE